MVFGFLKKGADRLMESNYAKIAGMSVDSLRYQIKNATPVSSKRMYILVLAEKGQMSEAIDACRNYDLGSRDFSMFLTIKKAEPVALMLMKKLDEGY